MRGKTALAAVVLAAATAWLYLPVTGHPFLRYDDELYVTGNPHVRTGLSAQNLRWALTATAGGNWHPLTWVSHMADAEAWGLRPGGHHAASLLLHLLNTVLLLTLLAGLTGAPWASAVVAGIFALHPIHVESVAWVAERKDVLSTFLALATLLAYARHVRRPGASRYLPLLPLYGLALMSKPMTVTLPVLMLVLDFWPLGRLRARRPGRLLAEKAPLLAMAAAASVVTLAAQSGSGSVARLAALGPAARLENAAVSLVAYVWKALWPARLAVIYAHPLGGIPWWRWAGAALLVAAATLAVLRLRERPYLAAGWAWYLAGLLPVLGLVQVGYQSMADRYMYLPLVGLCLMAVWPLRASSARRPGAAALAAATVLALLGLAAGRQLGHWRTERELFAHAVAVTGRNWAAMHYLGTALREEGKLREAEAMFRRSLEIQPLYPEARNGLGAVLHGQGRWLEAAEQYRLALKADPRHVPALSNLGVALAAAGDLEGAVRNYEAALSLEPGNAVARYNLALALRGMGRGRDADREYAEAVRLDPGISSLPPAWPRPGAAP